MGTIREVIAGARRRLKEAAIEAPGRESRLLLGSLLGLSEAALLARDDERLPAEIETRFAGLIARRERNMTPVEPREPAATITSR